MFKDTTLKGKMIQTLRSTRNLMDNLIDSRFYVPYKFGIVITDLAKCCKTNI